MQNEGLITKVAIAICLADGYDWKYVGSTLQQRYLNMAKAAVHAINECV